MRAVDRQAQIHDALAKSGFANLADLSRLLGVSPSTTRRDLMAMEADGLVQRVHGGVVLSHGEANGGESVGAASAASSFVGQPLKAASNLAVAKRAIADVAAGLVEDGDTVLLDGGTTTFALAEALVGRRLQVITNSIPVANLFVRSRQVEVILLGGVVYSRSGVALGPATVAMLEGLHCRRAFLSAAGVSQDGLYNSNLLLVETERAMIACADCVTVIADSTKFGRKSLAHLCPLSEIDELIVDSRLDESWTRTLEESSIELLLAGDELARFESARDESAIKANEAGE